MSDATEPTGDQGGNSTTSGDTPPANDFKPITTAAEMDAFLKDRVARAERKVSEKYADYEDLQAKAAKLDSLEQANLSEIEKANGRITAVETERAAAAAERDAARAEALRIRTAIAHSLPLEVADEFLTGTDVETLTAQAKRLSELMADSANAESDRRKNGPIVSKEGTSTEASNSGDPAQQFADIIRNKRGL